QEVLLQKILNSIEEGIIVMDQNYQLIHYNDLYAEMFGIPKNVLRKKDIDEIYYYTFHQFKSSERFLDLLKQALFKDQGFKEEFTLKDGRILKVHITPFEVYHVKGWVFNFQDIT